MSSSNDVAARLLPAAVHYIVPLGTIFLRGTLLMSNISVQETIKSKYQISVLVISLGMSWYRETYVLKPCGHQSQSGSVIKQLPSDAFIS